MAVEIGIYKMQTVRIINNCMPEIKCQVLKNEYKRNTCGSRPGNLYSSKEKRKKSKLELGQFTTTFLYKNNLIVQ